MTTWADMRAARTLYEDDGALVLDKPVGWSVMGERHDTDIVRIAADDGEKLWPAHRIDKVTSGVVLFAKQLEAHGDLTRQFTKRTVEKSYLAVTGTVGLPAEGRIELPLSVGRKNRVRIAAPREAITSVDGLWSVPEDAVDTSKDVYPSTTTFTKVEECDGRTLLEVHPVTGRRHQIRVHLAWIGHALVGDPLFEKNPTSRTGLHAHRLVFDAPDGQRRTVTAEPDDEFRALLRDAASGT
ncbi:RNA pseudouridine synthase [Actinomycetospora sp. NBRC 106378]|uniref:RluA family pseudouridine synthase n=1 Tax=Actinomycetospora sp. NBRC 106378 TaxID=3032208 RepID=UPI0024A1C2BE|nr:RNA pseudouridine synthase [Actinomycetospora sp. NBRC 106378]GLZ54200.1 RNA pseudouridine synthase [Actinomycetospora sp. NBRC 106378]